MKESKFKHFIQNHIKEMIMLAIIGIFYLTLFAVYGVQLCDDSKGYINMISAREPIYPLFLALNRFIFGEKIYLSVVVFLQNLLIIYAVWSSTNYLVKRFELKQFAGYIMILFNFFVTCLCQFIALKAAAYSNSIETEGLAIPLWIIFMTFLFKSADTCEIKYIWIMCLLTAIMMDVRKQMIIGFPVMFAVMFFAYMKKEHYIKKILIMLVAIALGLVLAIGITRIYNFVLRGQFAQNTRDMNLVLTTSLYVADSEDADLIKDDVTRELFIQTMEILENEKITYKYAGDSLAELNEHYGIAFDKITIDTTAYLFVDYAIARGFKEGMEAEAEADRMSKVIVSSLLLDNIGTYFKVYLSSVYDGLINSVAKRSRILDVISMLIYLVYTVLMTACLTRKESRFAGFVGLSVLFAILINVAATALVIFCQTRYMIYNMALFYCAGFIMLYKYIEVRIKSKM